MCSTRKGRDEVHGFLLSHKINGSTEGVQRMDTQDVHDGMFINAPGMMVDKGLSKMKNTNVNPCVISLIFPMFLLSMKDKYEKHNDSKSEISSSFLYLGLQADGPHHTGYAVKAGGKPKGFQR